jgi:hypothetical protein
MQAGQAPQVNHARRICQNVRQMSANQPRVARSSFAHKISVNDSTLRIPCATGSGLMIQPCDIHVRADDSALRFKGGNEARSVARLSAVRALLTRRSVAAGE